MLLMLLALLGYFSASPPADRHPGNPDAPIASARPLKAIEDVALGDWVLAHDPGLSPSERASASASSIALADPNSLRVILAEMPEGEGEILHVELLRTEAWLQQNRDQNALWLQFDELGIKGWATILSVHARRCRAVAETDAHLVTGRFVHETAVSYDLAIVDHTARLWSKRSAPPGTIRSGARTARTTSRPANCSPVNACAAMAKPSSSTPSPRNTTEPVYNLEVDVEHVYHVGSSGILVHNAGEVYPGGPKGKKAARPEEGANKTRTRLASLQWWKNVGRASLRRHRRSAVERLQRPIGFSAKRHAGDEWANQVAC